jgi:hypothetical protein
MYKITHQKRNAKEINVRQTTKLLEGALGDPRKQCIPMMVEGEG